MITLLLIGCLSTAAGQKESVKKDTLHSAHSICLAALRALKLIPRGANFHNVDAVCKEKALKRGQQFFLLFF